MPSLLRRLLMRYSLEFHDEFFASKPQMILQMKFHLENYRDFWIRAFSNEFDKANIFKKSKYFLAGFPIFAFNFQCSYAICKRAKFEGSITTVLCGEHQNKFVFIWKYQLCTVTGSLCLFSTYANENT